MVRPKRPSAVALAPRGELDAEVRKGSCRHGCSPANWTRARTGTAACRCCLGVRRADGLREPCGRQGCAGGGGWGRRGGGGGGRGGRGGGAGGGGWVGAHAGDVNRLTIGRVNFFPQNHEYFSFPAKVTVTGPHRTQAEIGRAHA